MFYTELSIKESTTIQVGQYQNLRQRGITRMLVRSPSTLSRELRGNRSPSADHVAHAAQTYTRNRRNESPRILYTPCKLIA